MNEQQQQYNHTFFNNTLKGTKEIFQKSNYKYDFIILGAGSAGSVLTYRLLKSFPTSTILLIEAGRWWTSGNWKDPIVQAGNTAKIIIDNDKFDWGVDSIDNSALLPPGRKARVARGLGLGGSSAINYQAWQRGQATDYNSWCKWLSGTETTTSSPNNPTTTIWQPSNVLNIFQQMEKKMSIYTRTYDTNVYEIAKRQGYLIMEEEDDDNNVESPLPFFYKQGKVPLGQSNMATKRGFSREDAFTAFVEEELNHPNLTVCTEVLAKELLFHEDSSSSSNNNNNITKTCIGIKVILLSSNTNNNTNNNNEEINLYINHDTNPNSQVIVSLGSLKTPQLLMLSGIGDENTLNKLNIKCKKHLPSVGQHLQDHPMLNVYCPFVKTNIIKDPNNNKEEQKQLALQKRINHAKSHGTNIFINTTLRPTSTSNHENGILHPKRTGYDITVCTASWRQPPVPSRLIHDKRYWPQPGLKSNDFNGIDTSNYYCGVIMLHQPSSRGEIILQSKNPFDSPILKLNMLQDQEDRLRIVDGMKRWIDIVKEYDVVDVNELLKQIDEANMDYDTFARTYVESNQHIACSCRMGMDEMNSVTKYNLKVHGINRLRIADASIMPCINSSTTNAPSMMIGWACGDLIEMEKSGGGGNVLRSNSTTSKL